MQGYDKEPSWAMLVALAVRSGTAVQHGHGDACSLEC